MPDLLTFCKWLEATTLGSSIRESLWLFPVIETLHLFGIVLLVGASTAFDLRLLGWALRDHSIDDLGRRLLPWAWAGFTVQVLTGFLLFSSEATKCYANPAFRIKMLLLVLAGVNAFIFHRASRRTPDLTTVSQSPVFAKIAGAASILLWLGIIAAGRFIGFV